MMCVLCYLSYPVLPVLPPCCLSSVLDMARHVPLYKSLLELLRGLTVCPVLVPLLLPLDRDNDSSSISTLLQKMKGCVDTYASRLK